MNASITRKPGTERLPVAAIVVIAALAGARTVSARTPAPPQRQPIAIVGATVHTVSHGVIDEGTVIFAGGKIVAVGDGLEVPEGAEVIEAGGNHVYPGFIHGRSALGLSEIARIAESTDLQELGDINPMIRAQVAYHTASEHLSVAAVHGVTTVVPTPRGSLIAGMPAAMTTDGWTWEAMTIREGLGMIIDWPDMSNQERYGPQFEKLQEAFDKARRYRHARAASDRGEAGPHPRDTRWEALLPVLDREMPVLVTVNDLRQVQAAIAWAEQEELRLILVGGHELGRVADQLAQRKVSVMLSGAISGPAHPWEGHDEGYQTARRLHEAGVPFCIAGDESPAYAYRLAHHAAAAVAFGLPDEEGLKAITLHAARALGIDDVLGSLEPGKDATLVIGNGHPLEIGTKTEQVFIQGRKIDMTDKHRQLYEHYRQKHRQCLETTARIR
jgi:imidazolonepropionase-like amidohydrolase